MIPKCTARIELFHPPSKDKVVRTLKELREIETETIRKRSADEDIATVRRMLAVPEHRRPMLGEAYGLGRTRWAEWLLASSPASIFNFNMPQVAALFGLDEFELLVRSRRIPVLTPIGVPVLPNENIFERAELLWAVSKELVFVPFYVISNARGLVAAEDAKIPKTYEFGVAGINSVCFVEEYALDGRASLELWERRAVLAKLHFTGPVPRLPPLEEVAGL